MDTQVSVNNHIKLDWNEDLTVEKALKRMNFTFKMLIIKINGELVKKEQYQTTKIPAGADVKIIHMISGG